ncbi:vegetative incompatibility protein het-e-1 [Colletotrichum tofieldiae]|nr:vegetative incompatibility protein het-e-1 [Colletotrichum tofieldiae]GKT76309.1 vegetative incompatibility protein het-e-1 [Colletotrichum tofieldiae]
MEYKGKRPRPDQVSDLDEKPRKRQAIPNAVYRNDSSWVHHILKQPDVGLSFDGNGIQNSGDIHVGGDINIGVQNRSEQDTKFLADLRSTDPHDDKTRIERTKGGLLRDSYRWILDHDDFRRWRNDNDQSRLLWIKGDPGKGKTMLLCGIIDELEKTPADTRTLSYFFCQATDARLNTATAVLCGLIYQLLN